jgi:hypothetical protein
MAYLDLAAASELLRKVVNRQYAARHSPVPAATVKIAMAADAKKDGNEFSEQELNFKKFLEFVRSVEGIAVQGRSGSDSLLAPLSAAEMLSAYASPLPRLRRDFWRAFIEFPVAGVVRLYDMDEDKIIHVAEGAARAGVEIDAIGKERQIEWRKTFAAEQPDPIKGRLLEAVESQGTGIFVEFARRLRENPAVMRAWNIYLQKQITDHVAAWAAKHKVSEDRWLGSQHGLQLFRVDTDVAMTKPQNIGQRAELYNFFDQLPIEDLLQLRVPLEWVLKVTRRGDA